MRKNDHPAWLYLKIYSTFSEFEKFWKMRWFKNIEFFYLELLKVNCELLLNVQKSSLSKRQFKILRKHICISKSTHRFDVWIDIISACDEFGDVQISMLGSPMERVLQRHEHTSVELKSIKNSPRAAAAASHLFIIYKRIHNSRGTKLFSISFYFTHSRSQPTTTTSIIKERSH
jgi:hypothetical protein